jgi:FAD/FMN-containing dehydrogenase
MAVYNALDGVQGDLLLEDHPEYPAARRVWNHAVDAHPLAIVRPAGVEDIATAVRYARQHKLPLAIRGGGHSVAGHGTCDGGVVLDLSGWKSVDVDPLGQTARVQPGATWGDLDTATQAHGLALTGGQISSTGVAGLTLGGGLGWLMRERGLTVDSLLSVDLITAEAEQLTASESRHPDLFWALKGGGGNFGVVTRFEFRLDPLGEIIGGTLAHPAERARDVLEFFRNYVTDIPESVTPMAYFFTAPNTPALPPPLRGRSLASIAVCATADTPALAPLRAFGPPLVDAIRPMPYTQLQTLFDAGSLPGFQNYWKSHYLQPLSSAAADVIADFIARITTPLSIVLLTPLGGAVERVPRDASAFGHRDAPLVLEILAKWETPGAGAQHIAWADEFWRAMQPFSSGGVYVNFLGDEPRVRDAYPSETFARLQAVKRRYDPDNVFRVNHNVPPAS